MRAVPSVLSALVCLLSLNACQRGASPEVSTTAVNTAQASGPASATLAPSANAHGQPPIAVAPNSLEKLSDGRVAIGPFSFAVPADWKELPSTSNMRAAQFQLPAPAGTEAEVIVYYFGETGAGSVDANVDRWLSQFKQADGNPATRAVAKLEEGQFAGQKASLISVSGRYVNPGNPGAAPVDKPDQSLFAAIVESPKGPYYFRLIGNQSAVQVQAPVLRQALGTLALR